MILTHFSSRYDSGRRIREGHGDEEEENEDMDLGELDTSASASSSSSSSSTSTSGVMRVMEQMAATASGLTGKLGRWEGREGEGGCSMH